MEVNESVMIGVASDEEAAAIVLSCLNSRTEKVVAAAL